MKNLENYGVQEMGSKESKNINGGIFGIDDLIIGVTLLVVGAIITDWDGFKAGISGGI
ncbi:MAG: hypothetical protein JKY08_08735 [Flavobacteriaceae bacterium]|nr:hypothetical protein [Flavobacteriaceae bacterium]